VAAAASGDDEITGGAGDVYKMRAAQSAQENLSDEVSTGVADVMDIDRTAELLIYLFQQMFRPRQRSKLQGGGEAAAAQQQQQAAAVAVPGAALAAQGTATPAAPPPGTPAPAPPGLEVATLGGGCFWGMEACLQQVRGVVSLQSGYAGGDLQQPTYRQVGRARGRRG
jgi:hypothetical protein